MLMPDTGQDPPLPQSEITAEQLLTRLLELIKSSRSITDFTLAKLQQALGAQLETYGPSSWGGRARLTPNWGYAINALEDLPDGARLRFSFFDNEGGTSGNMSQICQLDFDTFTGALQSAGFAKTSIYGEHGESTFESYTRGQLRVEVTSRGEAGGSSEKVLHQCIQSIMVR